MNIFTILLLIYAIIITRAAWAGHKRAAEFYQEKQTLEVEKHKISNAVREKGIEVDTLTREVKKLKDELEE